MFRLSRFMEALVTGGEVPPRRAPPGPVVIWNVIRRCNLTCRHCYSLSNDTDFKGELSTEEALAVLDQLKAARVPAVIFSGGEPLLRPDLPVLLRRAKALGMHVSVSSNGTLLEAEMAATLADCGVDYYGVSLDGLAPTHDVFRRLEGAFDAALRGVRLARDSGIKTGIRMTLTEANADQLPAVVALMEAEGLDKFYLSHFNYAGRGRKHQADDAQHAATRRTLDWLFEHVYARAQAGQAGDFVTGNNDADGVYLLNWIQHRAPDRVADMRQRLLNWGGNATGVWVANIDNLGNVHPDTMWWQHTLGNVRQRPFADIWADCSDPLMAGLKARPRPLEGRCGRCPSREMCNGNTRVRAFATTGNAWAADPGCYLTDAEVGLPEGAPC